MFLDSTTGAFLNIQHPVSSIKHLSGRCSHQEFNCKPIEKILCNLGVNSNGSTQKVIL